MFNDLRKVNGNFEFTEKIKEYSINPQWVEAYASTWELVSGSSDVVGQVIYEHIANYVQNIRDIDTCELHNLLSIATELDVEHIFSYDLAYPSQLEPIMNTISLNRSFLLTTGYMLHDETLRSIYTDIGVEVSAGVSGELSANVIWDPDYLTGFVEPIIRDNLETYSSFLGVGNYPTPELEETAYVTSLEYQGFMDDIYSDPQSEWNSSTSADIVDECTHILRNICLRASYQRETLKTIAQKHAMIGSTRAIEKLIGEYILRSFTKKEDWRLYVEPSGALKHPDINNQYYLEQNLPNILTINKDFSVDVVEYWDTTEYMNISAESPYLCGITGYADVITTTSEIDISGNILSGYVTGSVPVYGTGLCGYVVTGGNVRFWEGDSLDDAILLSEHTSAEISAFYDNVGLTGDFSDHWALQTYLWDLYATSGLDRLAVIPELTGTRTNAYSATLPSQVPESGWIVRPTSLSAMHWKYMGTASGDSPPGNYKNQIYPTIAPQPFLWNLMEKVLDEFPDIIRTLLYTEQGDSTQLSAQIGPSGDLVDSWKYFNHEFIGYQTAFEESNNLDYNEDMNIEIERDGPWAQDALSAYVLSADMQPYYAHIGKDFALSATMPRIDYQLIDLRDDVLSTSGQVIYNYAYDHLDNHYMLYKDVDDITEPGRLFMRYRNHPIAFPLSYGTSDQYNLQQMYMRGNAIYDLGYIVENTTFDFGFYDNVCWVLGKDTSGNHKLIVFVPDHSYFDLPVDEILYTVKFEEGVIPLSISIGSVNSYVGSYLYNDYIIFVYNTGWSGDTYGDYTATFKFVHYNRYTYEIKHVPQEDITIYDLPVPIYTPSLYPNVWRLGASEELVTIAYEGVNDRGGEFVNEVVTIDLMKSTLSTDADDIAIMEFYSFLENQ